MRRAPNRAFYYAECIQKEVTQSGNVIKGIIQTKNIVMLFQIVRFIFLGKIGKTTFI